MAFGSITHLPRFFNYNDAVEFFNNTKPIRGRTVIPLKMNRQNPDAYYIRKNGDNIECYLYRTPVLTYTPDSLIITCFNSQTTNKFINAISPHEVRAFTQGGKQRIGVRGEGVFVGNKVVIKVNPETYQPIRGQVQANKLEEVVLNRTKASEARKSVKDVVELARVTSKLDGYWTVLRENDEPIEDITLRKLRSQLQTWGVWGMTFEILKQKIYIMEYKNQDCYDYIPAPYGVIPKNYRSV